MKTVELNGIDRTVNQKEFWNGDLKMMENFREFVENISTVNKGFVFDNGVFRHKGKKQNGITKKIDGAFNYGKFGSGGKETRYYSNFIKNDSTCYMDRTNGGRCSSDLNAMDHGSLIDKQLYEYVNSRNDNAMIDYDDCTLRLIRFFKFLQWKPVLCQFSVCYPRKTIATSIDVICYSTVEKKYMFLEIKTSKAGHVDDCSNNYEEKYFRHVYFKNKRGGYDKIPFTLLIKHQIQLLLSKHVFLKGKYNTKKGGKEILKFDYKLIRIFNDGIQVYDEYPFTASQQYSIIQRVLANKKTKNRSFSHKKRAPKKRKFIDEGIKKQRNAKTKFTSLK